MFPNALESNLAMEGMTGGVHHAQIRLRLKAELRHLAAHIFQPLPVLADDVVSEESYVWEPETNPKVSSNQRALSITEA